MADYIQSRDAIELLVERGRLPPEDAEQALLRAWLDGELPAECELLKQFMPPKEMNVGPLPPPSEKKGPGLISPFEDGPLCRLPTVPKPESIWSNLSTGEIELAQRVSDPVGELMGVGAIRWVYSNILFRRTAVEALAYHHAKRQSEPRRTVGTSTSGAERRATEWLEQELRSLATTDPTEGPGRDHFKAAMKVRFQISDRAAARVWSDVAPRYNRTKPGRKKSNRCAN